MKAVRNDPRIPAGRREWRVELHPDGVAPADVWEAFEAAFAAADPGHRGRLASQWSWRSLEAPEGARAVCVRDRGGRVLAWYAAQVRTAHVPAPGEPAGACPERRRVAQALDTFAVPSLGPTGRAEAFVAACEAFMEAFCGPGAGRLNLCFGFPVRPAWRLGRARLGYEVLGNAWWFARPVGPEPAGGGGDPEPAAPLPATFRSTRVARPEEVDVPALEAFLVRVLAAHPVHLERTPAWLHWRLLADPARPWRVGLLQAGARVVGLTALRAADRAPDDDPRPAGHVAEFLVDPAEPGAAAALEAWLDREARALGLGRLLALGGDAGPELEAHQERGWTPRRAELALVGRSFERRRDAAWWGRHLRWTLADTDLCD